MVVSEIRSLYRDENDLFRTVTKRIYEEWNAAAGAVESQTDRIRLRGSGASTAFRQPCNSSRTAAWVAYSAGMGIYIGGLGVRAEVSGAGNRV